MIRRPRALRNLTVLALALLAFARPSAALARKLELADYLRWRTASGGQISPDGRRIVYSRQRVDTLTDAYDGVLWIMDADGGGKRFLVDGHSPRWSPTGDRLAYTAKVDGHSQIVIRWMDGREAAEAPITHTSLSPGALSWSSDGRWIAFVAAVPATPPDFDIALPPRPPGAKWTEGPAVVDTLHYRTGGGGFRASRAQIFVVSADGGEPRQVTSGDFDVGATYAGAAWSLSLRWTPDGRGIVYDGLREPDGLDAAQRSAINLVDVATGAVRTLTKTPGFWDLPRVSPDGRRIAYEGYADLKASFPEVQIRVMDADGANDHALLTDAPDRVWAMEWAADGRSLIWNANERGAVNLHDLSLDGRDAVIAPGARRFRLSSLSTGGVAAGTLDSTLHDDEVAVLDIRSSRLRRLTNENAELLAGVDLASTEEVRIRAADGQEVQGWLVKPPGFDPKRRYPLVLDVHGGPHAMAGGEFDFRYQMFAAHGYLVLYTNPRGSVGYGWRFANAIQGRFPGEVDYGDLMAAVDVVVARGFIDASRLYMMGCSGGGTLTAWAVGHTDRFAAAAVMCPVIDWISMAGTADVTAWTATRFATPFWTDPAPWLEHSPLSYVGKVTTPTLILSGEHDVRTPTTQAEEFYRALKLRGVDTKLLIFKNEGHGPWRSTPSNFLRVQLYLEKWFASHVKTPAAP